MGGQVCGIVLEGQSCSGKTSVFNALKKVQIALPQAQRNTVFLSEQYSQTLNRVNGKLTALTCDENLRVLSDRLSLLEDLSGYADAMGVHSIKSRGLFFVFERFHLNCAFVHTCMDRPEYRKIEHRLGALHALTVLCVIGEEKAEERLKHRAVFTGERVTPAAVDRYIQNQRALLGLARRSVVPAMCLDTGGMQWEDYAQEILRRLSGESGIPFYEP